MFEQRGTPSSLKYAEEFIPAPTADKVGQLARQGARWTFGLTAIQQVVGLATTAVLARFILPADFGLVGMVATLTALISNVSNIGLSLATVQRKDLTRTQVHNLFWINSVAGFCFWLLCVMAAPLLAGFYHQPKLVVLTVAIGAGFAIGGLAEQPMALLNRQMRFRQLTLISAAAQISGAIAAVFLALHGWGYWALVSQSLTGGIMITVLAFVSSGYRPGLPSRNADTLPMLSFGGYLTLSSAVTYFARNTDNLLVGRFWGAAALGFYSRAYFLMTLPAAVFADTIGRVMLPALSALGGEPLRMAAAYRKALNAILFAGLPAAVGLAIAAPEAVRLVYGPAWIPVVPLLAWLSAAMIAQVVGSTTSWLYMVAGRTNLQFKMNLLGTAILMIFFAVGVQFGVAGIAAGYALFSVAFTLPLMYMAHRTAGISLRVSLEGTIPVFGSVLMMGALTFSVGLLAEGIWHSLFITLIAKIATGMTSYALFASLWVRPWPVPIPMALQKPLLKLQRIISRVRVDMVR